MRNLGAVLFRRSSPDRRGESGADIVEAALVLPIVLMMMLGLVTLARGWDLYQSMTRAAREGVRQAVVTECAMCNGGMYYDPGSTIQSNVVFPALQAVGINTNNSLLTSSYAQGYKMLSQSNNVCGAYITFQYPYTIAIPFLPMNLGTVDLKTYVQMRLENDPGNGYCPPWLAPSP